MASCAPKRGRHCSSSARRLGRMDGHAARSVLDFLCIHIAHCRSCRTAGKAHHCRRDPSVSTTCHLSRTGSPTRSCRPNYFRVRTRDSGYLGRGGQILDARIVSAPKQRNMKEENQAIKAGETPKGWEKQPAKLAQNDVDARWSKHRASSQTSFPVVPSFGACCQVSILSLRQATCEHFQKSQATREMFLKYAYLRPSACTYILWVDDAHFFNHSSTPNTKSIDMVDANTNTDIAARDSKTTVSSPGTLMLNSVPQSPDPSGLEALSPPPALQ
jgi:hypothetical protein